jgi:hypothetical protein
MALMIQVRVWVATAGLLLFVGFGYLGVASADAAKEARQGGDVLRVTAFMPDDYVRDGSTSYQPQIQKAIDAAAQRGRPLVFPAMTYRLDDPNGLQLRSGSELRMRGAVFELAGSCDSDGQAFIGKGVEGVRLVGGQVLGKRSGWSDSVNIAGVRFTGQCEGITVEDMRFRDLSSNAIGIFAPGPERMTRDVTVRSVTARNCCNVYIDYLNDNPGPADGSDRKDQGNLAFYYVKNCTVVDCNLVGARSDGTHFFKCEDGRFVNSRVADSTMGGYFLEQCRGIVASGNLFVGNGSRGVTIERNSHDCTLINNVIRRSGREGLWAPDVTNLLVQGNVFKHNGQKDHDPLDSEIMIEERDKWPTETAGIQIAGNHVEAQAHQAAAIRISPGVKDVVVRDNTLAGETKAIRPGPWASGEGEVWIRDNAGWSTAESGVAQFKAGDSQKVFRIEHGLKSNQAWDGAQVVATVSPASAKAAKRHHVTVNDEHVNVHFDKAPVEAGARMRFHWQASVQPVTEAAR